MKLPQLELTETKEPEWFFRIRYPGEKNPRREYLGRESEMNRKDAAKALRKRYDEVRGMPRPDQVKCVPFSRRTTFAEYLKIFDAEHVEKMAPGSKRVYRLMLNQFAKEYGELRLADFRLWHIEQFLNSLASKSKNYRKAAKAALSKAFNYACKNEVLENSPVKWAEIGGGDPVYQKRAITADELKKLLSVLPEHVVLFLKLGVSTGMRRSEMLGLAWDDVNLETGRVDVRRKWYLGEFGPTKTDAATKEYYAGVVTADLRARRTKHPEDVWVFQSPVRSLPLDAEHMNNLLRAAAIKTGIYTKGFGYHALRRAYISILMPVASAEEIGAVVGKSAAQLGTYTVLSQERAEQLVNHVQTRLLQ